MLPSFFYLSANLVVKFKASVEVTLPFIHTVRPKLIAHTDQIMYICKMSHSCFLRLCAMENRFWALNSVYPYNVFLPLCCCCWCFPHLRYKADLQVKYLFVSLTIIKHEKPMPTISKYCLQ